MNFEAVIEGTSPKILADDNAGIEAATVGVVRKVIAIIIAFALLFFSVLLARSHHFPVSSFFFG